MNRLREPLLGLLALGFGAAVLAACTREAPPGFEEEADDDDDDDDDGTGDDDDDDLPPGGPYGDGRDGALVLSSTLEPNACAGLLLSTNLGVVLSSPLALAAGDRLLLWQVQAGNVATVGDTGGAVSFTGLDVGGWEIARVVDAAGDRVDLESEPLWQYESTGLRRAQACRLPQYTRVELQSGGSLRARAWNGTSGGIVAFYSSGSVLVAAGGEIEASARGFRGGRINDTNNAGANVSSEEPGTSLAGYKGEGLDGSSWNRVGRGNIANAGGSGNAHDSGGGGGGGGGAGGRGGWQYYLVGNATYTLNGNTAGRRGSPVAAPIAERLTMGGGGGDAFQNGDPALMVPGGNGGGVVLIVAPAIHLEGDVLADGGHVGTSTDEGGSGGGGGGTIVLFVDAANLTAEPGPHLFARGGNGGSVAVFGLNTSRRGPGGGGGGGRVFVLGTADIAADLIAVDGGQPGTTNQGSYWQATAGTAGTLERGGTPP